MLDHPPEHMVGCLHQQPVEVFFLPAWCAPVGLERCQAGCSHTSLLGEECILSEHHWPNAKLKETRPDWVWWFAAIDHLSTEVKQNSQEFKPSSVSWNASLAQDELHKSGSGHLPRLWLWEARGTELAELRMAHCPTPLCPYHHLGLLG